MTSVGILLLIEFLPLLDFKLFEKFYSKHYLTSINCPITFTFSDPIRVSSPTTHIGRKITLHSEGLLSPLDCRKAQRICVAPQEELADAKCERGFPAHDGQLPADWHPSCRLLRPSFICCCSAFILQLSSTVELNGLSTTDSTPSQPLQEAWLS